MGAKYDKGFMAGCKAAYNEGYQEGYKNGLAFGEMIGSRDMTLDPGDLANKLYLLSNALSFPVEGHDFSDRTSTWWALYVGAAAKELKEIAHQLPGTLGSVYEFEKDLPPEEENA